MNWESRDSFFIFFIFFTALELPMKGESVKATPKEEEKSAPPLQGMRVIYESILPPWYAERARELYEQNIKAR